MDLDSAKQDPLAPQSQKDTEFQPSRADLAKNCDQEAILELATSSLVPVGQACETSDQFVHRRRRRPLSSADISAIVEATKRASIVFEEMLESNYKQLAELELRLSSVEKAVRSLTAFPSAYHHTRNQFLSTFKKDKLGRATSDDWRIIAQGNVKAEGGDAATDALLYEGPNGRRDFTTFEGLYGLHPAVVRNISE